MKKWLSILVVFLLLSLGLFVIGLYVFYPSLIEPRLIERVQKEVFAATGDHFELKALKPRLWPLHLSLQEVLYLRKEPPRLSAKVQEVALSVDHLWSLVRGESGHLQLNIIEPEVWFWLPEQEAHDKDKDKETVADEQKEVSPSPLDRVGTMAVTVNWRGGRVQIFKGEGEAPYLTLSDWQLEVSTPSALAQPMFLNMDLVTRAHFMGVQLPIQLKVGDFLVSPEQLKGSSVHLSVAGLWLEAQGQSQLQEGVHDWQAQMQVDRIEDLPVPPEFLPPGKWRGAAQAEVKFQQESRSQSPELEAQLKLTNLRGDLDWHQDGAEFKGPVSLNTQVQVSYKEGLRLHDLQLQAVATQASIKYQDMLTKPAGTPLVIHARGQGEKETFDLHLLELGLSHLKLIAKGKVELGKTVAVDLEVPEVNIKGLDKLSPMMAEYPLEGLLQLKAHVKGDMQEKLGLRIDHLSLNLPYGRLGLEGDVHDVLKAPRLRLNLKAQGINLARMRSSLPALKDYEISGEAEAGIQFQGTYFAEGGLKKSPLQAKGSIDLHMPSYKFTSAEDSGAGQKQKDSGSSTTTTQPLEPVLPNWPLLRASQVTSNVRIDKFLFNDLEILGLSLRGVYDKGQLSGSAKVGRLFSGGVDINSFDLNLFEVSQPIKAQARWSGIQLQEVMSWLSDEYKDLGRGSFSGRTQAETPWPGAPDFLNQLQARGSLELKDGFFSTVQFDQMANETLAKIPQIGSSQSVNTGGARMDIKSQYHLAQGRLHFRELQVNTPAQDELKAEGYLGFDRNIRFSGVAYLKNPPIRGVVREANSDDQGRLVLPIEIQGNLMSPRLSFAQTTIQTLLTNTLNYEKQRTTQQLQKQAEDRLRQEVEKGKEKLEEQVKDRLRGIFGN